MKIKQTETFRLWESKLKDRRAKTIIATRLMRLAEGLTGDVAPVGEGVSELRIHHGPGYRVYFQERGEAIVVLLCGGIKASQQRDILKAKSLAREWRNLNG
jgi:putative addiction module killer protein